MDIRELAIDDWVRHEFYEMNMRVQLIDGDSERISAERYGLSLRPISTTIALSLLLLTLWSKTDSQEWRAVLAGSGIWRRMTISEWWQLASAQVHSCNINDIEVMIAGRTLHKCPA